MTDAKSEKPKKKAIQVWLTEAEYEVLEDLVQKNGGTPTGAATNVLRQFAIQYRKENTL